MLQNRESARVMPTASNTIAQEIAARGDAKVSRPRSKIAFVQNDYLSGEP